MPLRLRELAAAATVACGLSVVLTWPIAARFGHAGRLDTGDGRFSIWNVAWVAHALTTDPRRLFDANIFYPHRDALAYSEANLVAGALAVPVWAATGNPYAAANSAILLGFALSALAAYALARHLGGSPVAAAVSGCTYAYCPFVFSHLPHVQLLMTFGLPLTLLALHRFVEAPSLGRAGWLSVTLVIQGLACAYYGLYGGLAVAFGFIWFGTQRWRDVRYWGLAIFSGALAAAMIAPFLLPYVDMRRGGFTRTLAEARLYSVGWRSYLASPILADRWLLPLIGHWREVLFPGFLPLIFAAVAIVDTARSTQTRRGVARPVILFYGALAGFAGWASLGPNAGLYALLFRVVPFFSMLRAPARFGLLVTLALTVLGGLGYAAVERRLVGRRQILFAVAALVIAVLRSTAGPLFLVDAPRLPRAYERLAGLPWGPVVELPYFTDAADRSRNTDYMLMSTFHWKPLVNGYSDYIPVDSFADALAIDRFPDAGAWAALHRVGARYLVVHWEPYAPADRQRLADAAQSLMSYLRPVVTDSTASLYEIVDWPTTVVASAR